MIGVGLAFAACAGLLVLAWRRGRLGLAFGGLTVAFVAAWLVAKAAVRSDYRDADGYVDCWPSCSATQTAVKFAILAGPFVWVALAAVLAAVLAALTGPRGWLVRR